MADVSVLNNFVHSNSAHLLERLVGGPVHLSPTVLDVDETLLPGFPEAECASRFLKPLSMSRLPKYASYRITAPLVQSFALATGILWQPVELSGDEANLAFRMGSNGMRSGGRQRRQAQVLRKKLGLGLAEAEAAAVAVSRGWTLLTDDRATVELLQHMHPEVNTLGTCGLLIHAARRNIITCDEAAELFNQKVVDGLRHWAYRKSGDTRERLWLRCRPARCSWEPLHPSLPKDTGPLAEDVIDS
jgi:hypothetical protein